MLSISQTIKKYCPNKIKRLGQHFLCDPRILSLIAASSEEVPVIEIGAGPGSLTRALLNSNATHVFAIEKDARCVEALIELKKYYPNNLTVIKADALKINPGDVVREPYRLTGNLPYNISVKLITSWLTNSRGWTSITVTVQKEVADRMCAKPSTKEYGRLSVLIQLLSNCQVLAKLSPGAFIPPPKVYSSVIRLTPKPFDLSLIPKISEVTRICFCKRRKMLKNSIKQCSQLGIAETARPEELSPHQYAQIAKAFKDGLAGGPL